MLAGHVLFLDLGTGYMGEFTENSSSCTLRTYVQGTLS